MKTSILSTLSALLSASVSAGCIVAGAGCGFVTLAGSGVPATQVRAVGDFDGIEVDGSTDVVVEIGSPARVEVTGDDNLVGRVSTRVEDGTLVIGIEAGSYRTKSGLEVRVRVPTLDSVEIDGSADVVVAGLASERFEVRIAGSGTLRASGTVGDVDVEIAGSGDVELFQLQSRRATVSIAGSGDAKVSASDELEVSIAGSGDVAYRGSPHLETSIAGSGDVVRD